MIQFSCDNSIPRGRIVEKFSAAFGLNKDRVPTDFDERYPNVDAVIEMPSQREAGFWVTLPDADYPDDYPSGVEQRRSFTRLSRGLETLGKRVNRKVPWVRIPPPPPIASRSKPGYCKPRLWVLPRRRWMPLFPSEVR